METRRIGQLEVSVVGLGCNNFGARLDADETEALVHAAVDLDVNFFDTADMYGDGASEEYLGRAIKGIRDDVVIATKFGYSTPKPTLSEDRLTGGDPKWVRQAVDASLRRLDIEWIDLYLLHKPDPAVGIELTLEVLHELVAAGKVREIGCSNFSAQQLDEAHDAAEDLHGPPFCTVQNRYSAMFREPEAEVVPWCAENDTTVTPFFPLESGLLTGKIGADGAPPPGSRLDAMPGERRGMFLDDSRLATAQRLAAFARDNDRSLLELAMSYLVVQPTVPSVIAGAMNADQLAANVAATEWAMTADEVDEVREITSGTAGRPE